MKRLLRSIIELEIVKGGTPRTVVDRAVKKKKEAERAARSQRDDNLVYDEVWGVFDVDIHPFVPEAKQKARANGIQIAISNPCFELWVLLHFQEQHAHIDRRDVQSLCRRHLPRYQKEPPCDELLSRYDDAARRASKLDGWHESRGTVGENPSTGVYRLVDKLKTLANQ